MTPPARGSAVHPIAGFEAVREVWTALAEQSGNVFSTWEWASTWWREYGGGRPLRLAEVRRADGTTMAILPLYEWSKGPLKLLRFVGHGPGDQLGPVCDPADVPEVGRVLRSALEDGHWRCDGLLAEALPGDQGWGALLGAPVLTSEGSPVMTLSAPDWDTLLAALSRNHRQQIRRDERKLAKQHDVRFRLSDQPGGLEADLEMLFRLHDARWEGGSAAAGEQARRFVRAFATQALAAGWLRLWTLELDGQPVAAWLGFRYGDADFYYQQGRDPAHAKQNVGGVLLAHTIRVALEEGSREYRFLRGGEDFKYRYADRDPRLDTCVRPASRLGSLAAGSVSALSRSARGRRLVARYGDG